MPKYIKNEIVEIIDADEYDEYAIPENITETEAIIYDWVVYNYGKGEASNPSWNISALAKYMEDLRTLQQSTGAEYKQSNTVAYKL